MQLAAANTSSAGGDFAYSTGLYNNTTMQRGTELKSGGYSLTTNYSSISTTPTVVDVTLKIASGTGFADRIGRNVHLSHIIVNGQLCGGQTGLGTDDFRNVVRLSVMSYAPGTVIAGYNISSLLDPRTTLGLNRTLFDRVYALESQGKDTLGYLQAYTQVAFRVNVNKDIIYGADGAAAGNPQILFTAVSDSLAVPNPGFTAGTIQWFFTDK
jgi:hypothetical protein